MLNKETIEEVFIEAPHRDNNGKLSAIPEALELVREGFKDWYWGRFPSGQQPRISAGPKILPDGTEGFYIKREILYKDRKISS